MNTVAELGLQLSSQILKQYCLQHTTISWLCDSFLEVYQGPPCWIKYINSFDQTVRFVGIGTMLIFFTIVFDSQYQFDSIKHGKLMNTLLFSTVTNQWSNNRDLQLSRNQLESSLGSHNISPWHVKHYILHQF